MKIFLTVAKIGNLNKAADELFLTRQNLSFIIKNIENELDLVLFTRDKKGVKLTDEGKAFYNTAQTIVASYNDFLAQMSNNKIIMFNIYATPNLTSFVSSLGNVNTSEDYLFSFHKRNIYELANMLSENQQGIYIVPIHDGDVMIPNKQKDAIVLREDHVVRIAHKDSNYMSLEQIEHDKVPLITNSDYNPKEHSDILLVNCDNLSVCKNLMQTRGFCYADTKWTYEKFFEQDEAYIILGEKKEKVSYTLILNLPNHLKEIVMNDIVPKLKNMFADTHANM